MIPALGFIRNESGRTVVLSLGHVNTSVPSRTRCNDMLQGTGRTSTFQHRILVGSYVHFKLRFNCTYFLIARSMLET